jgi:hypothetical protein
VVPQLGAEVEVTNAIQAKLPDGVSDHMIRTISENFRRLKFATFGFEKE